MAQTYTAVIQQSDGWWIGWGTRNSRDQLSRTDKGGIVRQPQKCG